MFRTLAGFGKIAIGVFQHRVLIAMSELVLEAGVSWAIMIGSFCCTLARILIWCIWHDSNSVSGSNFITGPEARL